MVIRVLAIGDVTNNFTNIRKFVKKSSIHLLKFPKKEVSLSTYSDEGEFFDSIRISKQVKYVKKIKNRFDVCVVNSWAGGRVAYLAGLNYIMYFVGDDIRVPPFLKMRVQKYLKTTLRSYNFVERKFYKNILDNAIFCVASSQELYNELKKYRMKDIALIELTSDITMFNENIKPIQKEKTKFTFLCPHRNGLEKGTDLIWKALSLCKSDFRVLMVDWFDKRTEEEEEIAMDLLNDVPKQVEFIPIIKRTEMPRYLIFADAIIGQMRIGYHAATEIEASFCKKPIIHYADPTITYDIDAKKTVAPFLPHSRDPKELAEIIDKVVMSKEFREKLAQEGYNFMIKMSGSYKIASEWDTLFENCSTIHKSINKPSIKFKIFNLISNMIEKLVYNRTMQQKNIDAFGELEYKRLTR